MSLDDTFVGSAFVFDFGGLGGRDLSGDFHLTFGFLLDLFLLGDVNFTAVNGRFEWIRWQTAAIRIDVHLGTMRLARLAARRRLTLHRLPADDRRHLVVSLLRLFCRVIPVKEN